MAMAEEDLRKIAAAAWAGLAAGFVVLGWGSRLAMMLLARLNPQVTGLMSDDGFRMGEFNFDETVGLVLFGTFAGMVGGLIFLLLRDLRFGPPWFRTASMVVGPAVVGGNMLVHTDGVDFRLLDPAWLPIALFVALPGLYAWAVMTLADRWLEPDGWFRTGSRWRLLMLIPAAPALLLFAGPVGFVLAHVTWRRSPRLQAIATRQRVALAARLLLTAAFAISLVVLADKTIELT